MSKLYTFIAPKTLMFLDSKIPNDIDLTNYVSGMIQLHHEDLAIYAHKEKLSLFHDRIMQITGDWVLDFQSAEQGEHLVLTIRPEDFYYSDYPRTDRCAQEEIESRLAIARELGFEIIESEI